MSFSTLGSICSDRNTDRIKKLKEYYEKEETKKLTKRDVEFYERVNTGKLTTLHGYRKLYGHCRRSEEQLYVAIYNCSIDAKVLYKREHANDTVDQTHVVNQLKISLRDSNETIKAEAASLQSLRSSEMNVCSELQRVRAENQRGYDVLKARTDDVSRLETEIP